MIGSRTEVAAPFVDLIKRYPRWDTVDALPDDDTRILFDVVMAAGFEPKAVKPGKLRGNILDQDSSWTGETFAINKLCAFKVQGKDGKDHYRATKWLDTVLSKARDKVRSGDGQASVTDWVATEIERSIPLEPIQLTPEGDFLLEYPPSSHTPLVDHTRDDKDLGSCVGVHKFCNGWFDRRRTTETHDVLLCRSCSLRLPISCKLKTYGDLRKALAPPAAPAP